MISCVLICPSARPTVKWSCLVLSLRVGISAMVVKFTVAGTVCARAGESATAEAENARAAIRYLVTSFSLQSAQLLGARCAGAADKAAGQPRSPGATLRHRYAALHCDDC